MYSQRTNWNLAPNRFTIAVEEHRRAGREMLDLTASNPTSVGLKYDPEKILSAFANPELLAYRPEPKGLRAAREQVSSYYAERGDMVDPEHLILTTSTSEAYSFVFRLLCDPGDEVLIPSPSYPLFEFLAQLQDVSLKPYRLFYDHGWHVDIHTLRSGITPRTRAIMAVHPNNPTGSYLRPPETDELSAICAERDLAMVVDEVFLDFALDGQRRFSFVGNSGALTFTLSGLSKISGLPQMKFAWIHAGGPRGPVSAALRRLEVISDTYLSMNAPVQLASPALFRQRHTFQPQLMSRIGANLQELDRQLSHQQLCERLEIAGGWYAVLRVPVTRSDEELAIELLEQQSVLVHPGHFYDFQSDGYAVVSLITREDEFAEGVQRMFQEIENFKT